jgi:hypothetical protein
VLDLRVEDDLDRVVNRGLAVLDVDDDLVVVVVVVVVVDDGVVAVDCRLLLMLLLFVFCRGRPLLRRFLLSSKRLT